MKLRIVTKALKALSQGRKTPLLRKVGLKHISEWQSYYSSKHDNQRTGAYNT